MNPNIVTEKDLMNANNCTRRADLERILRDEKIRFYRGIGGVIWTTTGNIERVKENEKAEVDF